MAILCYACQDRPAKKLETSRMRFKLAAKDPVFCSKGCAADWGLLYFNVGGPVDRVANWCLIHGWQDVISEGAQECYQCELIGDVATLAPEPEEESQ